MPAASNPPTPAIQRVSVPAPPLPDADRAIIQSIKTLEEAKKTLQADKAAVTGEKMNLELQLKSNGARLQALEKENEKLRDKAGKIGEARSEAQQVSYCASRCCEGCC